MPVKMTPPDPNMGGRLTVSGTEYVCLPFQSIVVAAAHFAAFIAAGWLAIGVPDEAGARTAPEQGPSAVAVYDHSKYVPAEWNHALLPLTSVKSYWFAGDYRKGSCGFTADQVYARFVPTAPVVTYYVNSATGSDANSGLTPGAPLANLWYAVSLRNALANAATTPVEIIDNTPGGGIFPRNSTFFNNGGAGGSQRYNPVGPTIVTGVPGARTRVGVLATDTVFTADATYTNTSSATRSNVDRVLDLLRPLATGGYFELRYAPSEAACNARPDTWTLVAGKAYINRGDGALPVVSGANPNTMIILSGSNTDYTGTPVNLYFRNIEFLGGNTSMRAIYTARPASPVCHIFENCVFSYSGGATGGAVYRGLGIDGLDGLVACFNCSGTRNSTDFINMHYTGNHGGTLFLYTENCAGFDTGITGGTSCNQWTTHKNVVAVDLCGRYVGSRGFTVGCIDTTVSALLGTHIEGSWGDRDAAGGTFAPGLLSLANTAKLTTDMVTFAARGGEYAALLNSGTELRIGREIPTSGVFIGAGTITRLAA